MKIEINKIKTVPKGLGFNFCVYGEPSEEIQKWCKYWDFKTEPSGPYTNIILTDDVDIKNIFVGPKKYHYIDGFSPNLNKNLHVGHLSNLVLANAFQHLGLGDEFISIFGDTLNGEVTKDEAYYNFLKMTKFFGYKVDKEYFASEMKLDEKLLKDGQGDYEGSKVFDLEDEQIVGIKSSGATTYFYQDVALANELSASTLYLTGLEQENHFNSLKKLFPNNNHIGLGLVYLDGKKMSSSEGNIIYMNEFIHGLMEKFNHDAGVVANIIIGQILKSEPKSKKTIDSSLIDNPRLSLGLYLSYTLAHVKSCGVTTKQIYKYQSKKLQFAELRAKTNLSPNVLFDELVSHCKHINALYETHYIKGNEENIELFSNLISDLELGMLRVGMYSVEKV